MSQRTMVQLLTVAGLVTMTATTARSEDENGNNGPSELRTVEIDDITMKVPKDWKQEQPSNKLRKAQFKIPAENNEDGEEKKPAAELVVSHFGGTGGGVQANIRRWFGQFEPEGSMRKLFVGESPQGKYIIVDIQGTYKKPVGPPILRKTEPLPNARMLAVILHVEDKGNYFLKLTGPRKTVTAAAGDFRASFGGDAGKEEELKPKSGKKPQPQPDNSK